MFATCSQLGVCVVGARSLNSFSCCKSRSAFPGPGMTPGVNPVVTETGAQLWYVDGKHEIETDCYNLPDGYCGDGQGGGGWNDCNTKPCCCRNAQDNMQGPPGMGPMGGPPPPPPVQYLLTPGNIHVI